MLQMAARYDIPLEIEHKIFLVVSRPLFNNNETKGAYERVREQFIRVKTVRIPIRRYQIMKPQLLINITLPYSLALCSVCDVMYNCPYRLDVLLVDHLFSDE